MQIANTTYTYIILQKMGAKVSTLLFRPPKPTQMSEENYFYLFGVLVAYSIFAISFHIFHTYKIIKS